MENESKDGFSGGASAGMPAQAAGLSFRHFARNRFEFRRTKEPNSDFFWKLSPVRAIFGIVCLIQNKLSIYIETMCQIPYDTIKELVE